VSVFGLLPCICCPQETSDSGDVMLSAILGRLDEIQAKTSEPAQDHLTEVYIPRETEQRHQVVSDVSDMFESVGDRGKNPTVYTFVSIYFYK